MTRYYAKGVTFKDPAFGTLVGSDAMNMWKMLCGNAKDLKVTFEIRNVFDNKVEAYWEANYTFSKTGRRVHNKVNATFTFLDGQIISHTDHFNLWVWSQQALGLSGWLLGWSGAFQKKFQKTTQNLLKEYTSKN